MIERKKPAPPRAKTTELPGHSAPSAGFEAPLEMLGACHHRIERQCATLRRLVAHLASQGADDEARAAAAAVMRYFDSAAGHHHTDEEQDLFPALIESMAGSDAVCLHGLIDGLVAEHRELEVNWQRVRSALERVVAGDGSMLTAVSAEALVRLYEQHIEREERELLPMAARLLSDDALQKLGSAMRQRRGIDAVV